MTAVRVSSSWLALREQADAGARADDLVDVLLRGLPAERPLVVHDLACGTGSMLRWLAHQLPGPQYWVCHDLDAELLAVAANDDRRLAADGSPVIVEIRHQDVTLLEPEECERAGLITTSALLDLLSAEELDRLVATCVHAQCPALLTLSVTGRVQLWPPDPLDTAICDAFNAHQRRVTAGRRLMGPDAADRAADTFRERGYEVLVRGTPWRLGPSTHALTTAWLDGWLTAACEQSPDLVAHADEYVRRRRLALADGRLRVLVQHRDLLVRPPRRE